MIHDEQPVSAALNGVRRIVLSCSPAEPEALVLGHLLAEGWIASGSDVMSISVAPRTRGGLDVFAEIDPRLIERHELLHRHQTLHGCGLRHVLDCDPSALTRVVAPARIEPTPLLRELFARTDELAPQGGVHGVALSDGDDLLTMAIDVARHCAVDRALGLGLRDRGDVAGLGLVSTARISGAIALKAARARLGWIASRSIATSLAREIADACGMLLIERGGRPQQRP